MPKSILKNIFGYDAFRPLQEDIITSVLNKEDSVVLMPTGGGKSLCYQIPAIYFEGCAIVVSPLISLMQDQVMALNELGVNALCWNSTLDYSQVQHVTNQLKLGKLKLLYVSPERLTMDSFLDCIKEANISFFAIDEAHCISEWGHEFRPSYRSLELIRSHFESLPIMTLTATATTRVVDDIQRQLNLYDATVFQASFNRPNLFYEVRKKKNTVQQLFKFLQQFPDQSGIIYCQSRKSVDSLTQKLVNQGFSAKAYHAGLSQIEREQNQTDFIYDRTSIIVATIAFGMGINKSNVRFVVHYDLPKTIENYYQETGRAGRDGLDSQCLLFFSYADKHKYEAFLNQIEDVTEREFAFKKLSMMLNFAAKPRCRRIQLLEYFEEDSANVTCGTCDICKNPPQMMDITTVSQKVLSCIYRVNENYGINMVIDILKGNKTDRIKYLKFDKLSTFGIEKELTKSQLHDVISHLTFEKIILIVGDEYPVLKLTEAAWRILRDQDTISMPVFEVVKTPKQKPKSKFKVHDFDETYSPDANILDKLKDVRRKLAQKKRVPAYIIFHDKTLAEMAAKIPKTQDELLEISGVGAKKATQYGEYFLSILKNI